MKNFRAAALAGLVALLLAACGGSDPDIPGSGSPEGAPTTKGSFTALVSFGDSLSDLGTYAPATSFTGNGQPPYFGGKWTTNGPGGTVWVENLAAALGLVVTPAEVGFAGQSLQCPAAAVNPALAGTCTGYGQGGSRVTDPEGLGKAGGALTVPVKTQIANHLARFGRFKDSDLIVVWAGHNDIFVQFGIFGAKAAQIQAQAAAGQITEDQAKNLLLEAQLAAQEAMKQVAIELGGYIKREILAKGGKYVAVANLVDIAATPFSSTVPVATRPVLTTLSETFNLWLRDEMTGQPVQWIDAMALFKELRADSARFDNVSVPACDAAKIAAITGGAVTEGSSLFCNATPGAPFNGLRDGADVQRWLFADGVHPTIGGHKATSEEFAKALAAFGWI
jgi:phospholipase/lecithinase/hemolysin